MNPKYLLFGIFLFIFTIVLPTWIIFPVALIALNFQLNLPIFFHPLLQLLAFFVAGAGLYLIIKSFTSFCLVGHGTPAPILPPKKIVTQQFYAQTRNPMYIGYLLIYLGLFLAFGHLLLFFYFLVAFISLHYYLIIVEEPILRQRYGKTYLNYCKKTPRWI